MKNRKLREALLRVAAAAAAVLLFALLMLNRDKLQEMLESAPSASFATVPASADEPSAETPSAAEDTPEDPPDLEVYFLDVGQGDSTLIRLQESGRTFHMLIDTGEYAYADGLTDTLRSLGVERLDVFLITHPHTDHMGCAARIVQRFEIGAIAMPRVTDRVAPTTAAYEALLNAVEKKGLTITDLRAGSPLCEEAPAGLKAEVFSPRPGADWNSLNNWSAVVKLTYGETSFLFTGDAERDALDVVREDAAALGWNLNSTVLKCSHHGSNDGNPAKWLKAVGPEFAVISCGAGNDYGHPHHEPLERLEALGTQVYRTDEDGTVLAVSNGVSIAWQTGLPSVS